MPEYEVAAPTKQRRYVDGALLHALRVPFGYWEAKDSKDDLDAKIVKKFRRTVIPRRNGTMPSDARIANGKPRLRA